MFDTDKMSRKQKFFRSSSAMIAVVLDLFEANEIISSITRSLSRLYLVFLFTIDVDDGHVSDIKCEVIFGSL